MRGEDIVDMAGSGEGIERGKAVEHDSGDCQL